MAETSNGPTDQVRALLERVPNGYPLTFLGILMFSVALAEWMFDFTFPVIHALWFGFFGLIVINLGLLVIIFHN